MVQADGSDVFMGEKTVGTTGLNTRAMTMKFDSLNEREIRGTEITNAKRWFTTSFLRVRELDVLTALQPRFPAPFLQGTMTPTGALEFGRLHGTLQN